MACAVGAYVSAFACILYVNLKHYSGQGQGLEAVAKSRAACQIVLIITWVSGQARASRCISTMQNLTLAPSERDTSTDVKGQGRVPSIDDDRTRPYARSGAPAQRARERSTPVRPG